MSRLLILYTNSTTSTMKHLLVIPLLTFLAGSPWFTTCVSSDKLVEIELHTILSSEDRTKSSSISDISCILNTFTNELIIAGSGSDYSGTKIIITPCSSNGKAFCQTITTDSLYEKISLVKSGEYRITIHLSSNITLYGAINSW